MKDRLLRLSLLLTILGVLLLLPVFCRAAQAQTGSDDVTARVEAQRMLLPYSTPTTGVSMAQFSRPDNVRVEAKSYADLQVGDIVVFWPAGRERPVMHRLVGRFGGLWRTQGMNLLTNSRPDPWYCTPTNFIGIVRQK